MLCLGAVHKMVMAKCIPETRGVMTQLVNCICDLTSSSSTSTSTSTTTGGQSSSTGLNNSSSSSSSTNPEIHLKILQLILPLLSTYPSLIEGELLSEALVVCFRMCESRLASVQGSARATLRQVVSGVFDKIPLIRQTNNNILQPPPSQTFQNNLDDKNVVGEFVNDNNGGTGAFRARYLSLFPHLRTLPSQPLLDAYLLFQDICLLSSSRTAMYIPLEHLPRSLGLDLIESLLTSHRGVFEEYEEFRAGVGERVCPLVIRCVEVTDSFAGAVRSMRCVRVLMSLYSRPHQNQNHHSDGDSGEIGDGGGLGTEYELFLSAFTDILASDRSVRPEWHKILCLEVLRSLFSDAGVLKALYLASSSDDESGNGDSGKGGNGSGGRGNVVFHELVKVLWKVASRHPEFLMLNTNNAHGSNTSLGGSTGNLNSATGGLSITSSTIKVPCIDQLDKFDPPPTPDSYGVYLALNCFLALADGMSQTVVPLFLTAYACESGLKIGAYSCSQSILLALPDEFVTFNQDITTTTTMDEVKKNDIRVISRMMDSIAVILCDALMFFICGNLEADLLHNIFRSFQNLCCACGVLSLKNLQKKFIDSLCSYIVDNVSAELGRSGSGNVNLHSTGMDSAKVVMMLRILVNISHALSHVLTPDAWYDILKTLRFADVAVWKNTTVLSSKSTGSAFARLQESVENLFVESACWDKIALQQFLHGWLIVSFDTFGIEIPEVYRIISSQLSLQSSSTMSSGDEPSSPRESSGDVNLKSPVAKVWTARISEDDRVFVVDRLFEAMEKNMNRLFDADDDVFLVLWNQIVDHLVNLASFPAVMPNSKKQLCTAIAQIIVSTLNACEVAGSKLSKSLFDDDIQKRVLFPLKKLVAICSATSSFTLLPDSVFLRFSAPYTTTLQLHQSHQQVQMSGLEILQRLLQMCGDKLSNVGYVIVFQIFEELSISSVDAADMISSSSDPSASVERQRDSCALPIIRVAFPSLQLICTDFLGALHGKNLLKCIKTIGLFASQKEDLNISLTSIGLLWSLCDTVRAILIKESRSYLEEEGVPQMELIKAILFQLKYLIVDERNEIRNTAIQTLFRALIMTFGPLFEAEQWLYVLRKVVLPALVQVRTFACEKRQHIFAVSSVDMSDGAEHRGQQLQIIGSIMENIKSGTGNTSADPNYAVRQTNLKQINESVILAMGASGQLISEYLPKFVSVENFFDQTDGIWTMILDSFFCEFVGFDIYAEQNTLLIRKQFHDVSAAALRGIKTILAAVKSLESDDKYLMMRMTFDRFLGAARNINRRKAAVCWCLNRIEPLVKIDSGNRQESGLQASSINLELVVDLVYKPELLISFIGISRDIWSVLYPRTDFSHVSHTFSCQDFRELLGVYRSALTYYDMSYMIPAEITETPVKICCEIAKLGGYGKSSISFSNFANSLDIDDMTFMQETVLGFVLGSKFISGIRESDGRQSTGPFVPSALLQEEAHDMVPPVWQTLFSMYGSKAITVLFDELSSWTTFAFRTPFSLSEKGAKSSFRPVVNISSIAALCRSLKDIEIVDGEIKAKSGSNLVQKNMGNDFIVSTLARDCPLFNNRFRQDSVELPAPTYVALSKFCMKAVAELFCSSPSSSQKLSMSHELYTHSTMHRFLNALEIPMTLKYACINMSISPLKRDSPDQFYNNSTRMWKTAYECFILVVRESLASIKLLFASENINIGGDYDFMTNYWHIIVSVVTRSLKSKSLPPSDASFDEFAQDESFEIRFLSSFTADILPFVGDHSDPLPSKIIIDCPDHDVSKFIHTLSELSLVYPDAKVLLNRSRNDGRNLIVPTCKEKLSEECLRLMFLFVSEYQPTSDISKSVHWRLALMTFPVLMQRCTETFEAWSRDYPLSGSFPFPRAREKDMISLLSSLAKLKLEPGIMASLNPRTGETIAADKANSFHLKQLYPHLCKLIPAAPASGKKTQAQEYNVGDWLVQCLLRLD